MHTEYFYVRCLHLNKETMYHKCIEFMLVLYTHKTIISNGAIESII
jgi:hypothetical protein